MRIPEWNPAEAIHFRAWKHVVATLPQRWRHLPVLAAQFLLHVLSALVCAVGVASYVAASEFNRVLPVPAVRVKTWLRVPAHPVRPPAVSAPNFGSARRTGAEAPVSAPKICLKSLV